MDKQLKNGFLTAVKKQCELYTMLNTLSATQQKVIKLEDSAALVQTAKKQEELIAEIRKNETEKIKLLEKIAVGLGLKYSEGLKLQEVLAKAGDEDAAEIDRETVKLIKLMQESISINVTNSKLMKNFLQFMEFSNGLKERLSNPAQSMYTAEGAINKDVQTKAKFDKKI